MVNIVYPYHCYFHFRHLSLHHYQCPCNLSRDCLVQEDPLERVVHVEPQDLQVYVVCLAGEEKQDHQEEVVHQEHLAALEPLDHLVNLEQLVQLEHKDLVA